MIKKFALGILMSGVALVAAYAQTVAQDNFETFANGNPTHAYDDGIQYGDNGGTGFGGLTYLSGTGGGIYTETAQRIDEAQTLGIFADGGGQSLGRAAITSVTLGIYSVDARFNVDTSVGFTGFNIKSGLGSTFGTNELLSFGLNPANGNAVFLITDGTGPHTLSVGTDTQLNGALGPDPHGPASNFRSEEHTSEL